jgi:hypothetical protein
MRKKCRSLFLLFVKKKEKKPSPSQYFHNQCPIFKVTVKGRANIGNIIKDSSRVAERPTNNMDYMNNRSGTFKGLVSLTLSSLIFINPFLWFLEAKLTTLALFVLLIFIDTHQEILLFFGGTRLCSYMLFMFKGSEDKGRRHRRPQVGWPDRFYVYFSLKELNKQGSTPLKVSLLLQCRSSHRATWCSGWLHEAP